jgi:hypothetical protein
MRASQRAAWRILAADIEFARQRYAASALWGMKVVILQANSDRAGEEGLLRAARAYEAMGRAAKALSLYEECLAREKLQAEARRQAEQAVARLRGEGAGA